jgi:hypothetical protein
MVGAVAVESAREVHPMTRYDDAIARIDAANGEDPNRVRVDGAERPAELVYAERMSQALARLHPDAREELRLAARAQHIRRWTVPRDSYPAGRAGYLRWRNDLKRRHAEWTGEILVATGYGPDEIARVGALIRKDNLKGDAEAQALEDVACLVFLEHYVEAFAAKHERAKLVEILRKTWSKMSARGQEAALQLPLSPPLRTLLAQALPPVAPP